MKKSSFNLTSLVVIVILLGLLSFALFPAVSNSVMQANLTAVGCRGRDIYVAITGANTEREPLGLPPVWSADQGFYSNAVAGDISSISFSNSTDYFMFLYDHKNIGTTNHNPFVYGFDYSKLAGAGVGVHSGSGPLKPENNMWTIIGNYREDMPDVLPIMFTRNVAAESMAKKIQGEEDKKMYFDTTWRTPFSNTAGVFIRKGGGVIKVRAKYMTWPVIYNKELFDVNQDSNGEPVDSPLKYLTPTHEVIPSEETYNAGQIKYKPTFDDRKFYFGCNLNHFLSDMLCSMIPGFIFGIFFYSVCFVVIGCVCLIVTRGKPVFKGVGFRYWFYLCMAVSLYFSGLLFFLAIFVQYAGCKYLTSIKDKLDAGVYIRARRCMLAAPLVVLLAIIIFSIMVLSF